MDIKKQICCFKIKPSVLNNSCMQVYTQKNPYLNGMNDVGFPCMRTYTMGPRSRQAAGLNNHSHEICQSLPTLSTIVGPGILAWTSRPCDDGGLIPEHERNPEQNCVSRTGT